MREIRTSGSEGGATSVVPTPIRGEKSGFIVSGLTTSYEYDIFMHIKEMNWRPHANHAQHRG